MKQILFSIALLLTATAVQAQRTKCVHRFIPYPEKAKQAHVATRAVVGNPKTYKGERRGLIILMEYQDLKFNNKNKNGKTFDVHDFWNDIANKQNMRNVNGVLVNGSVGDYFRDQSYGLFNLVFDVCGPYTAKNKYAYYGRNVTYSNGDFDGKPEELVVEACQAADKEVNFKDYDWDDDGEVDQVYVIYAGHGEASYNDPDCIWPHASELSSWDAPLTLQNLKIDSYAMGNELDSSDRTMGIGTICHEFSHCLGLPDVYDAATGESIVGEYDVMDAGNYNGDSWYPAGYSSFERYFCGWIEPKEIASLSEADTLSMAPLHLTPDAYIIRPFVGSTNYWLIEKRQKASWDKFLSCFTKNATGEAINEKILYWYIDYEKEKWNRNRPNEDHEHPGVSLVEANQVPTAITAASLNVSQPVGWYDLNGRLLPAPPAQHGIYVVRLSDGTTKKCIR
ncbi:MAG: M6 family metalloprotease domain-containing protein [Prevotella sp.]|nr:M6 family metalloprotease domain-containing protein [Prevotella sp.]